MNHPAIFRRTKLMLGTAMLDALAQTRVAVFGLGGVGSWCAESLARSGVGRLMLVDSDRICIIYSPETAGEFAMEEYGYVIDAIDSLREKAALIRHALSIPTVTLFASMGAALKMDPFQICATEFRKIEGDALARALRTKFKKTGGIPARKFTCVWSPERRENLGPAGAGCGLGECVCPKDPGVGENSLATHEWCSSKARINGTVAHTTAIFGFALAGLVIQDVERRIRA